MTNATPSPPPPAPVEQPLTPAQQPNLFPDVQGDGVTTSSFDQQHQGPPAIQDYQDDDQTVNRSGDEIRTEASEIATLVTIDLEQIPNAREVTVTLFLPRIVLQPGSTETAPATIGVRTVAARRIEGQIQTYQALNLSGTARLVASYRRRPRVHRASAGSQRRCSGSGRAAGALCPTASVAT